MTHPDQGPPEPPTTPDPWLPGQPSPSSPAAPPPEPWSAPVYSPGSAAVPQWQPPTVVPTPPPATPPGPGGYPPAGYPPPGYGTVPYHPGAVASPPKRRTGLIVAIVAAVLVLCLGGLAGGGLVLLRGLNGNDSQQSGVGGPPTPDADPSTAGPTSAAPSVTRAAPPAASRFTGDLRDLLVPRPAGASPWPDFPDADRKLDLNEAKALFTDPDAAGEMLSSFDYQRGAVMDWTEDRAAVLVMLFQFDSTARADGYKVRQQTNGIEGYDRTTTADIGSDKWPILVDDTADRDGDRGTIAILSRGDIVSFIMMTHHGAIDMPAMTRLVADQLQRLPAP